MPHIFKNVIPAKAGIQILLFAFLTTSTPGVEVVAATTGEFVLPAPGAMVPLSPEFNPPILKGIKVHPDNPFRFDFILDKGDSSLSSPNASVGDPELKGESTKLIKYFLASLTIPEKDLWVNLSPYEKNRIIPPSFGLTEMGRDLLAEDYMLKQITASLIYPEGETGKRFWARVYQEAAKKFGTTNIPVNTFNKVWIVPEKAVVYENTKAGTAYIVESKLKVLLEEDYLSLQKHNVETPLMASHQDAINRVSTNNVNALGSQIVREIVIPELTKEVNYGRNFAQLRQVYNSFILASWYKKKIKDSILEQVYADKKKVAGVEPLLSLRGSGSDRSNLSKTRKIASPAARNDTDIEFIYQHYLQAFKKGVYNYIKEEQDPLTQETIPRKYFSGGVKLSANIGYAKQEMLRSLPRSTLDIQVNIRGLGLANASDAQLSLPETDHAMNALTVEQMRGLFTEAYSSGRIEFNTHVEGAIDKVASCGLILRKIQGEWRFLFPQRSLQDPDGAGNYAFPAGGADEPKNKEYEQVVDKTSYLLTKEDKEFLSKERESVPGSFVREMKEELGLEIEGIHGRADTVISKDLKRKVALHNFIYIDDKDDESVKLDPELERVQWIPLSVLLDPDGTKTASQRVHDWLSIHVGGDIELFINNDHFETFRRVFQEVLGHNSNAQLSLPETDHAMNTLNEDISAIFSGRNIKIVAMDLDRSLADPLKELSPEMVKALVRALKTGKRTVILTDDNEVSVDRRLKILVDQIPSELRGDLIIFTDSANNGYTFTAEGKRKSFTPYDQKNFRGEGQVIEQKIRQIIGQDFRSQLRDEKLFQRLSPGTRLDFRIAAPYVFNPNKLVRRLQDALRQSGIDVKVYTVGRLRKGIRIVRQHKEDALRMVLKEGNLSENELLIMADEAAENKMDAELLSQFPAAVSINLGKPSAYLSQLNKNAVWLPRVQGPRGVWAILTWLNARDSGDSRPLKVTSLYHITSEQGNDDLFMRYSQYKHGSVKQIEAFAEELSMKIDQDLGPQIQAKPDDWVILSNGMAKSLAEIIARKLGTHYANVIGFRSPLKKIKNYDSLKTKEDRINHHADLYLKFETDQPIDGKKIILIDDLFNTGGTLIGVRDFIEDRYQAQIIGAYTLVSLETTDPSLEERMGTFLVSQKGFQALVRMYRDEKTIATRRALKTIILNKKSEAFHRLLALPPKKSMGIVLKGVGYVVGGGLAALKAKTTRNRTTNSAMLGSQPQANQAMKTKGGIDLTSSPLQVSNRNTDLIKFHMDPAMLSQLQNATGFVPAIINVKPVTNLREFLETPNI